MILFKILLGIVKTIFLFDPNMNFFGARTRRKEKEALASVYGKKAKGVEEDIAREKALNPFETASSKSAMNRVTQNAKQMQTKMLNTMGAGASPEAMIATQGATNKALGSATGQIATGAEALKQSKVDNLKSQKMAYENQQAGLKQSAINERGQNYKDMMSSGGILSTLTGGIL